MEDKAYFEIAKMNMIKNQIMPSDVNNENILDAFYSVPREKFVPEDWKNVCYYDGSIKLSEKRYILQPEIFAKMLKAVGINLDAKVLDIGSGTGYSAAVIAEIAKEVIAIESEQDLAHKAAKNLAGSKNISVKHGELLIGDIENAPYDIIFINGVLDIEPTKLIEQLSEQGRLIFIKKLSDNLKKAVLVTKKSNGYDSLELFNCNAPNLF